MSERRTASKNDEGSDGPVFRMVAGMTSINDTYFLGDVVSLLE